MRSEATRKALRYVPAVAVAVGDEVGLVEAAAAGVEGPEVVVLVVLEPAKAALANVHGRTKTRPVEVTTTENEGTTRKWLVLGLLGLHLEVQALMQMQDVKYIWIVEREPEKKNTT